MSALGAVMAVLYSPYTVVYAGALKLLDRYIDKMYAATGGSRGGDIRGAIRNVARVEFTVVMAVSLQATLVPRRAVVWNPRMFMGKGWIWSWR